MTPTCAYCGLPLGKHRFRGYACPIPADIRNGVVFAPKLWDTRAFKPVQQA